MRKGLDEKFDVVLSFALVVTDMEIFAECRHVQMAIHDRLQLCWVIQILWGLLSLCNIFQVIPWSAQHCCQLLGEPHIRRN
jgi:hypothetical protein